MYVHYFFLRVQFPFKGKKAGKASTTVLCFISSGKTCLFFLRSAGCNERRCLSIVCQGKGGRKMGWKNGREVVRSPPLQPRVLRLHFVFWPDQTAPVDPQKVLQLQPLGIGHLRGKVFFFWQASGNR